jgi:hypothetical protein
MSFFSFIILFQVWLNCQRHGRTLGTYVTPQKVRNCCDDHSYSCVNIVNRVFKTKFNNKNIFLNLMFIGLCIIVIADEKKTNLMSLAILFYFLCTQHVSDINISIARSLRLCCWITTLVVLFLFRCVLGIWCGWVWVVPVLQAEAASACNTGTTQNQPHQISNTQRTEQDDQCGNSTTQSQAPDDGYINVRNMLST